MSDTSDPWEPDWDGAAPRASGAPSPLAPPSRIAEARKPRRERWRPGPALVLPSLLPGALLIVTLLGVGLRHDAPPWEACLSGALMTVLPVLGLSGLFGHRGAALMAAMWAWPVLALVALPTWFPGERTAGMSEGFAWLALPLGETWSGRAASVGDKLGGMLGAEESLPVARPLEVEGEPATPAAEPAPQDVPGGGAVAADEDHGAIVLPYEGDGSSMRVRVTFDGPEHSEELLLLFDTGATFTTMDRETLRGLGVNVPANAPTARFNTANGTMESPMVLLDRIWLGDRAIDGVTIAVCDDCRQGEAVGLLGLNVTAQFQARIDHDLQEVVLEEAEAADRHLDITHWLEIQGQVTRWPTGRVVVELTGTSRANRAIRQAVVEVECPSRSFAAELSDFPPLGTRTTRFELPRGAACDSYRVILRTADWGKAPGR